MKLSSFVSILAVSLSTLTLDVEAIPAVRTYRGVSRYKGIHLAEDSQGPFLARNPREIPGTRSIRLSSNSMVGATYLDEIHDVKVSEEGHGLWNSIKDGVEKAIERLDKVGEYLGGGGNGIPIKMVTEALESFSHRVGIAFHLEDRKKKGGERWDGLEGSEFNSSSETLRWGDEAELAASQKGAFLPNLPSDSGFDYGNTPVRGVNIGNWLVMETWMDRSLTNALNSHAINAPYPNPIVDEWTAGLYSDYNWASYVFQKHFDTWMTESDWKAIADAGLNHVRIPVPYFMFKEAVGPNVPYLTLNRFAKLKEGVQACKRYGLKVWIDLHSVPGSQNGFDNSGHAGAINWAKNPSYYTQTQYAFNRLVTEFSQPDYKGTVTAIEAVNEPKGAQDAGVQNLVNQYYPWARDKVARPDGSTDYSTLLLAIHDAFQGLKYWQNFWTGRARHRVLLDTHPYFVYTDSDKAKKDVARLQEVCDMKGSFITSERYYPSIAGEFGINGPNGDRASDRDLPVGPVKFPAGRDYPYSVKYMAFMARNFRTQQHVYESGSGWIMWAWKNTANLDWSYQEGLKWGWIPSDLDAKPYGDNICDSYPYLAEMNRERQRNATLVLQEEGEGEWDLVEKF
ncbi:glycoside hydrolase [Violaceomyces palustris]|uniref:Glycoside hydrolase n=1 Tax=Violaceomyces palustris TaxID=1673888 RepID=A0ACD0NX15_9BASI|nr:glycoside hydrolase [Violaceomyces palustris]